MIYYSQRAISDWSKIYSNVRHGFPQGFPDCVDEEIVCVPDAKYTKGEFEVRCLLCYFLLATFRYVPHSLGVMAQKKIWTRLVELYKPPHETRNLHVQVVMQVVRLLPDGHRIKREVDMALDVVSETMTPMHYHLREIIICSYKQVSFCTSDSYILDRRSRQYCHMSIDGWHLSSYIQCELIY